jgi:hypothetical protein
VSLNVDLLLIIYLLLMIPMANALLVLITASLVAMPLIAPLVTLAFFFILIPEHASLYVLKTMATSNQPLSVIPVSLPVSLALALVAAAPCVIMLPSCRMDSVLLVVALWVSIL